MKIEFMLYQIKQPKQLYEYEKAVDETWGEYNEKIYHGIEYCNSIMSRLQSDIPNIIEIKYSGSQDRIANEVFEITANGIHYSISFTIDSFTTEQRDKENMRLLVRISTNDSATYDELLERIKIIIKDTMLHDWNSCLWITDEQSQFLCAQLYPHIFVVENKIRAFANKVLVTKFGIDWNKQIGLEKYMEAHRQMCHHFRRISRSFSDIDDFFISITLEMLSDIIQKAKVYESRINLSDALSLELHTKISGNSVNSVYEKIRDARTIKIDLWQDVFSQYFVDHNNIKILIRDFIQNRNHVAHNKLIDKATTNVMMKNISDITFAIDGANTKFEDSQPSDELYLTWQAEHDAQQQEDEEREWYDHGYYLHRIESETGIVIRNEEGIFDQYLDALTEMYEDISNKYYFDYAASVTEQYAVTANDGEQKLFHVKCSVDENSSFDVYVAFEIIDGPDEDSHAYIWIRKNDGTDLFRTDVLYHNGSAHEDDHQGCYLPDSESEMDDSALEAFKGQISEYIENDMNVIKKSVIEYESQFTRDGYIKKVADFPCFNCNQLLVSIDNSIYPLGHCINCGEDNLVYKCFACGKFYQEENGDEERCDDCLAREQL